MEKPTVVKSSQPLALICTLALWCCLIGSGQAPVWGQGEKSYLIRVALVKATPLQIVSEKITRAPYEESLLSCVPNTGTGTSLDMSDLAQLVKALDQQGPELRHRVLTSLVKPISLSANALDLADAIDDGSGSVDIHFTFTGVRTSGDWAGCLEFQKVGQYSVKHADGSTSVFRFTGLQVLPLQTTVASISGSEDGNILLFMRVEPQSASSLTKKQSPSMVAKGYTKKAAPLKKSTRSRIKVARLKGGTR